MDSEPSDAAKREALYFEIRAVERARMKIIEYLTAKQFEAVSAEGAATLANNG